MTVTHLDDALTGSGCLRIVRDHYDRLIKSIVQLAKHLQNQFRVFRIEIAGRFVRQDNRRPVDDGARQGDALLLAARKLEWLVMHLVFQVQHSENLAAAIRIVRAVSMNAFGQSQVAFGSQCRKQIKTLKDKSDLSSANVGSLRI